MADDVDVPSARQELHRVLELILVDAVLEIVEGQCHARPQELAQHLTGSVDGQPPVDRLQHSQPLGTRSRMPRRPPLEKTPLLSLKPEYRSSAPNLTKDDGWTAARLWTAPVNSFERHFGRVARHKPDLLLLPAQRVEAGL